MDSQIAQLILSEQQTSYALTDENGVIQTIFGDQKILWGENFNDGAAGRSIFSLLPELVGMEDDLQAILTGQRKHLSIESLNRFSSTGKTCYVTLRLGRYDDPQTGGVGLLVVAQDVTEQNIVQQKLMQRHNELSLLQEQLKRRNQELAATNTELRLMNEIRSSFISVAAHELRTPLTSIYGFLELLKDSAFDNLNQEQQEHLELIEDSTERLLLTLNELLDAARIDSDRLELVLRPTPIREVIDEALFGIEPRLAARSQHLSLDLPDDLPLSLCDSNRMEQVLGHLLSNASKFTPEGGALMLAVRPVDGGEFLHISVSDQGQGIDKDEEENLFERFYRGQQVRKNGVSGVGLGLYITRSLVELHGGEIWYDNQPGQGCTFHVTVPAVDGPPISLPSIPAHIPARADSLLQAASVR